VRAGRSESLQELKALAAHANVAPAVCAHTMLAAVLDQWFARSRATWSPTTIRNLTSMSEQRLRAGEAEVTRETKSLPPPRARPRTEAMMIGAASYMRRIESMKRVTPDPVGANATGELSER
jgi:hypothetical protein